MRRALVIAPNWIGDALMAQPLFARLVKLHPRIVIDAVAPSWVAPVLERMPEIRDVYATDLAHGKLQMLRRWQLASDLRDVGYDELLQRVIQTANLLHAQGIGPDDTVTLLMPSVPETFFALWGAEIAAVANPVNYFLEASQIAAIMKQAGARALIAARVQRYGATAAHSINLSQNAAGKWEVVPGFRTRV